MQNQFKPGDLALITGSRKSDSPHIGKVVQLCEFLPPGATSKWIHQESYTVTINGGGSPAWIVLGDSLFSAIKGYRGFTLVEPWFLMPIDGDDYAPQLENKKELTHE